MQRAALGFANSPRWTERFTQFIDNEGNESVAVTRLPAAGFSLMEFLREHRTAVMLAAAALVLLAILKKR